MTRPLRVVVGATLVAGMVLATQAPAVGAKAVSAKRFAAVFCDALVEFRSEFDDLQDELDQVTSEAAAGTAQGDPTAIVDFVDEVTAQFLIVAEAAGIAAESMRDLPKPRVDRGAYIRRNISDILGDGFEEMAQDFAAEATTVGSIPDPAADFQATLDEVTAAGLRIQASNAALDASLSSAFDALDEDVDRDGKLERAFRRARACQPLFG